MEALPGYIATAVVSLAVGYLLTYLEPRPKLAYWLAHVSAFTLPATATTPAARLSVHGITVQNIGRRRAEGIEIAHNSAPDIFRIWPDLVQTTTMHPNAHVIQIPDLGPGEWFTVNILTIGDRQVPSLLYIRSRDGQAQQVPVLIQRATPRSLYYLGAIVFISGAGFLLFWLIKALVFIADGVLRRP